MNAGSSVGLGLSLKRPVELLAFENIHWVDRVGQTHFLEATLILRPFGVSQV
jgi:hypothetical protein